jgi:hypothetical protein
VVGNANLTQIQILICISLLVGLTTKVDTPSSLDPWRYHFVLYVVIGFLKCIALEIPLTLHIFFSQALLMLMRIVDFNNLPPPNIMTLVVLQ